MKEYAYPNGAIEQVEQISCKAGEVTLYVAPDPTEESRINQDSLAIIDLEDEGVICAVADGCGGSRSGHEASALAVQCLVRNLVKKDPIASIRATILSAFEEANREILELGVGAATTLTVAHINSEGVRTFHVGDSAVYVFSQGGTIKHRSIAHSPVGYAVESGMVEEKEAFKHEERHVISNVLGFKDMHIELGSRVALSPRDRVFLSTDGLLDNILADDLVEKFKSGSLKEALSEAVIKAQAMMQKGKGKPDDMAILLFSL